MTNTNKEDVPKGIEGLSEKIHHLYCEQYLKDKGEPYWTNGDYSKLTEQSKEYDRNIARFILTLQAELMEQVEGKRRQEQYIVNAMLITSAENVVFNQDLDDTKAIISSVFGV